MKKAYLSLGSNIGDRLYYLDEAANRLNNADRIGIVNISSVYKTAAWGLEDQNDFYNIAIEIATDLPPHQLLDACQKIESELDRTRDKHWGPRTIDIDILVYGDMVINDDRLTVPHKFMLKRAFVLIPLAEIAGELVVSEEKIEDVAKRFTEFGDGCEKLGLEIKVF